MKKLFLTLFAACVMPIACGAATYYVSPGQSIQPVVDNLQAGDTLFIRGGIYYESVIIKSSGVEGQPITIKAYPGEEVILCGIEPVSGWQRCSEDDEYLTVQGIVNHNYQNIFKARVHSSKLPADQARFMLFENGQHSRIARWPDQIYGYGIDRMLFHFVQPEAYGETAFLRDSTRLVQNYEFWQYSQHADYWVGAWIDIFSHAANANMIRRNISSSSSSEYTITFSEALANPISYGSLPDSYSIVNHPHVLDSAGEFAHTIAADNEGYYTFYLWPKTENSLVSNITIPSKANAFYAMSKSYINIEGVQVRGYTGHGIYLEGISSNYITSVNVSNCIAEDVGGTGIYLVRAHHSSIKNCEISRVGGRGAFINTGSYGLIEGCTIMDTASTNASFYSMQYGQIIGNTLYGCIGSHGNGSSCYINCDKILIAYNYYPMSNLALQDIKNVVVFGNVFDAEENRTTMLSTWADAHGRTEGLALYFHNTILGSSNKSALSMRGQSSPPYPQIYTVNNIIDGCNSWEENQVVDISYNFYTGYGWRQSSRYGWILNTGEIDGRSIELAAIFANPGLDSGGDYTLNANNPVSAKGKNIASLLDELGVTAWFPDFDFKKDKAGNWWANPPSIGAYEYGSGAEQPHNPEDPNNPINPSDTPEITELKVLNNVIKGANTQATVKLLMAESGNASVKIYDSKGKEIICLWDGYKDAGEYDLIWTGVDGGGSKVGSGVYMVHMKAGGHTETKKIVVIK